jgi:hypothetical protein
MFPTLHNKESMDSLNPTSPVLGKRGSATDMFEPTSPASKKRESMDALRRVSMNEEKSM